MLEFQEEYHQNVGKHIESSRFSHLFVGDDYFIISPSSDQTERTILHFFFLSGELLWEYHVLCWGRRRLSPILPPSWWEGSLSSSSSLVSCSSSKWSYVSKGEKENQMMERMSSYVCCVWDDERRYGRWMMGDRGGTRRWDGTSCSKEFGRKGGTDDMTWYLSSTLVSSSSRMRSPSPWSMTATNTTLVPLDYHDSHHYYHYDHRPIIFFMKSGPLVIFI